MRLAPRVVLYAFTIIVALVVAILAIVDNLLHSSITAENASSLERDARFIAVQWLAGAHPDSLANTAGKALQRTVRGAQLERRRRQCRWLDAHGSIAFSMRFSAKCR